MEKLKNTLPKYCDICQFEIGLYKPFYTQMVDSHFVRGKITKNKVIVCCPQCYKSLMMYMNNRKEKYINKIAKAEVEGRMQ